MVESGREWFEVVANDHRNGKSRGTSCRTKAGDCVMFMGEYNHTVDPKGRLIVPAKFREQLGDEFVVTKGLDGCLFVYTSEEWHNIEEKFRNISMTSKDARICKSDKRCRFSRSLKQSGNLGQRQMAGEYI